MNNEMPIPTELVLRKRDNNLGLNEKIYVQSRTNLPQMGLSSRGPECSSDLLFKFSDRLRYITFQILVV